MWRKLRRENEVGGEWRPPLNVVLIYQYMIYTHNLFNYIYILTYIIYQYHISSRRMAVCRWKNLDQLHSTAFNSHNIYIIHYMILYDTYSISFIVVFNDQWIDADPENIQSKAGIPKKDHNHISISVTQIFISLSIGQESSTIYQWIIILNHSWYK